MRIKSLLKPVVSLAVTMSVVLSMGVAIFAGEAGVTPTPCSNYSAGDTISAGTVVSSVWSHGYCYIYFYASVEDFDDDNPSRVIRGYNTWTADDNYIVIDTDMDSDWYYDLYLVPASSASSDASLTPEQLRQLSVNIFVETLYERILGRNYDVTGRDYWVDQLMNHGATGADVVRGIISSAEFNAGDLSEEERVLEFYRDLFNRIPSAGETANWTGAMKDGASSDAVMDYFLSSPEWEAVCAYYCVNF